MPRRFLELCPVGCPPRQATGQVSHAGMICVPVGLCAPND